MTADLSESESVRYAAQIKRIGREAQLRLRESRAIVVGAGAAGSTAAAELASRGVGYVAVVDGARVSVGDLFGQALLYTPDVGSNRAEAVVAKLGVLNPHIHAESYPVDVDEANAGAIVMGHDVAVDCSGAESGALAGACAAADVGLVCAAGDGIADGARAGAAALELLEARAATSAGAVQ